MRRLEGAFKAMLKSHTPSIPVNAKWEEVRVNEISYYTFLHKWEISVDILFSKVSIRFLWYSFLLTMK